MTNMKARLIIFLLIALCITKLASQEQSATSIDFGGRVIQDYLFRAPYTRFFFEDLDTHQMAAGFLNSYADSITTDTIFFIRQTGVWCNTLKVIPGDTLFGLDLRWREGGYRTYEAYKTPFLNLFSKTYWEDLCQWDTAHISKPIDYIVNDGINFFVVRLIYHSGQLFSVDSCFHEIKLEYDVEWYHPEKVIYIPYPKDKQWPKMW